jgi:hypothetical protein
VWELRGLVGGPSGVLTCQVLGSFRVLLGSSSGKRGNEGLVLQAGRPAHFPATIDVPVV